MSYKEALIWDLMESEALIKVFIDREGFKAEKPAIILVTGIYNLPKKRGHKYTLWFGKMARWSYKSIKDAIPQIKKILNSAKIPIKPRLEFRYIPTRTKNNILKEVKMHA